MVDFDLSEIDQYSLLIAVAAEIIIVLSAFSNSFGWDAFPLWLKIALIAIIGPFTYFLANKLING